MSDFDQQLGVGKVTEGLIARWLQASGSAVMPAYEVSPGKFRGPRLSAPEGDLIAPDILAFNTTFTHNGVRWVESKRKTVWTWYRKRRSWQTGIDRNCYEEYRRVAEVSKTEVWLLSYHRESEPSEEDRQHGCPPTCPTGLFGGDLARLTALVDHGASISETRGFAPWGMVYWNHADLELIATKAQVVMTAYASELKERHPPEPGHLPKWAEL